MEKQTNGSLKEALVAIKELAEELVANEFYNVSLELLDKKNNCEVYRRTEMNKFMLNVDRILEVTLGRKQ